MTRAWVQRMLATVVAAALLGACGPPKSAEPAPPRASALRVGVDATSPPYAFAREGRFDGLEIDFARQLAAALGRPLELVNLPFDQQIRALLAGDTDVIMAGMTITPARQARLTFSDPYLRSGLLAMMRRSDRERYPTPERVRASGDVIGAVQGTTGERFVREQCPGASVAVYPRTSDAVHELLQRRADLLVLDAPVAIWFASGDEAELAVLLKRLNEENLGWAFRPDDTQLSSTANAVLAGWRSDGTLDTIVQRWLPYWRKLAER